MAETIRERIEVPPDGTTDEEALADEWEAGNLIPRDVHEAGIAAAKREGMERVWELIDDKDYISMKAKYNNGQLSWANMLGEREAAIRAEIAAGGDDD